MEPELEELESLADPSSPVRCAVRRGRDEATRGVLVIAFAGIFGFGSRGNPDGEWMRQAMQAVEEKWMPKAIVLDLSRLHYEWGDMLEAVLPGHEGTLGWREVPAALVVGDDCREAIRTLIFGESSHEELETLSWVHDDLASAWQDVCNRLEAARRTNAAGG